jgi:hypothetical protein
VPFPDHVQVQTIKLASAVLGGGVAVSPERIPKRVQQLSARSYHAFPQSIHLLDVKVQNGRRAAHALQREDAQFGKLISAESPNRSSTLMSLFAGPSTSRGIGREQDLSYAPLFHQACASLLAPCQRTHLKNHISVYLTELVATFLREGQPSSNTSSAARWALAMLASTRKPSEPTQSPAR